MGDHTPRNRSWQSPPCPDCETDVFVDTHRGYADWVCHFCGTTFYSE